MAKGSAEILISVDENGSLEVKTRGDTRLTVALLGACHYAQNWLAMRINSKANISDTTESSLRNSCSETSPLYTQSEDLVDKQEALNLYLDAREKLEARMNMINSSDSRVKFKVPRDLLNNL